eukprot:9484909-Pyramimonas_sp.AAC.1
MTPIRHRPAMTPIRHRPPMTPIRHRPPMTPIRHRPAVLSRSEQRKGDGDTSPVVGSASGRGRLRTRRLLLRGPIAGGERVYTCHGDQSREGKEYISASGRKAHSAAALGRPGTRRGVLPRPLATTPGPGPGAQADLSKGLRWAETTRTGVLRSFRPRALARVHSLCRPGPGGTDQSTAASAYGLGPGAGTQTGVYGCTAASAYPAQAALLSDDNVAGGANGSTGPSRPAWGHPQTAPAHDGREKIYP